MAVQERLPRIEKFFVDGNEEQLLAWGDRRGIPSNRLLVDVWKHTDGRERLKWAAFVEVTPELAAAWRSNCPYDKGRPISEKKVVGLTKTMLDDTFEPGLVQFSVLQARNILNDYNHRLEAQVRARKTYRTLVEWLDCRDNEDIINHFCRTDIGTPRNDGDRFRPYGFEESGRLGNASRVNLLSAGLKIIIEGFHGLRAKGEQERFTRSEWVSLMEEWEPAAVAFFDTVHGVAPCLKTGFRVAGLIAVALATFKYCPDEAKAFWGGVAANDELKRDSGEYTLVQYLTTRLADRSQAFIITRMVADCWNAAYTGKKPRYGKAQAAWNHYLGQIIGHGEREAIFLHGTPYNGRSVLRISP